MIVDIHRDLTAIRQRGDSAAVDLRENFRSIDFFRCALGDQPVAQSQYMIEALESQAQIMGAEEDGHAVAL